MIEYKFDKEKEIVLYFAKLLEDEAVLNIIEAGSVNNKEQVQTIAKFYWSMVDLNAKSDKAHDIKYNDMEKWLERIYTTFHIYFNNTGYGDIWDNEIP
jgi:hypothetical protein